jgi:hypothetical protein
MLLSCFKEPIVDSPRFVNLWQCAPLHVNLPRPRHRLCSDFCVRLVRDSTAKTNPTNEAVSLLRLTLPVTCHRNAL